MAAEKNTSDPPKPADSSLELDDISLSIDGTNRSAGATPLSPSTDDPSSPNEQHHDSTAKATVLGETSSPVPPPAPAAAATDESTNTTTTTTDPAEARGAGAEADSSPPSPSSGEEHRWLRPHYHDAQRTRIKTPEEIDKEGIPSPPSPLDATLLDRFRGSIVGMAIGDALGAHVEFRPRSYLVEHPVTDFSAGGTWGLKRGQFTDDTSMALCLAASLIEKGGMDPYDQLVKYKCWFRQGYMSSTGECFDIGAATSQSLCEFERRQRTFAEQQQIEEGKMDAVSPGQFDVNCSEDGVAGNGALMRLGPVPLFFSLDPRQAIANAGQSGRITHGDVKARDACRYYAALIVAALRGCTKEKLLSRHFYPTNRRLFGTEDLVPEIEQIAQGSFRRARGYEDGIRGKGYIVPALEAALWAFWSTKTFEEGALAAVNLGDDTDTTAAIYGQLAGAFYGYARLDGKWKEEVYAKGFLQRISEWLLHRGTEWKGNDGEQEPLLIDFPIDADESEGTAAALTDAPPTGGAGTEVVAPSQPVAQSLPPPPPQAETTSDVTVSPVHTSEEQPAVPVPATPSEQSSTGLEKGTEGTAPPSVEAAPSANEAANEPVQPAVDVTTQCEQVTEEPAPPPPPPAAVPVAAESVSSSVVPADQPEPTVSPTSTPSASEAVAPPADQPTGTPAS